MPELDKLSINIETNAKGSYNAIGKFAEQIGHVATALNGVNTSKMSTLASGISQLGNSMVGIKSVGTADFTRLVKNVNKLNTIDTSNISKVSASVRNIGSSINSIANVGKSAEQLSSLAKGISQLGYKSSTKAIDNIPKLATAMNEFMATMSNAPKVSQNLIDMTNAMAKFARTGSSGGNAANSLAKSFNGYSSSAKTAKSHSFSLASAIGKVYATYWMLFRIAGKVKDAINISADLTEVQNVVDVTFGNMAGKVEKLADVSIEKFGMSELALKQYASRFQSMGSAMSIDTSSIASANKYLSKQTDGYVGLSNSMSDVSLTLTKLTADMASFYNMEQSDVAQDLESIFTGQTRPLRTYGLDLTEATLREWALKNGMDANIDSMSQAQKTMLRYKYVLANTTNAQGDFERTADTWTNQVRILKQNLEQLASVIGGTLVGALKPLVRAMNVVVGQITNFATIVSNAIGKIFGWTYEESGNAGISQDFESAADSSQDIADSTGTAAENIKKMNAGVRAFDKLTVINTNNSSSSSGGSGSSSSGNSSSATSGQWTQGSSIIKSFESEIDTLYKLGAKISSTLISAMEGIDWESIYEKARGFGSGLAYFLNGLFTGSNGTTLFGSLGKTIAGALNTAVQSALSFAKTFDFKQFGVNIADGINNFFETFDFVDLADSLNEWVDGLEDAIKGVLKELDVQKIANSLKLLIDNLEIDTVGVIISVLTIKKIGGIAGLGKALYDLAKLGVAGTIAKLKLSIPTLQLLFQNITLLPGTPAFDVFASEFVEKLFDSIGKLIPEKARNVVSDILAGMVVGVSLGAFGGAPGMIAGGIIGAIIGAMNNIKVNGKSVLVHILDGIFNWDYTKTLAKQTSESFKKVKEAFKNHKWLEVGENIVEGIFNGIGTALTFIVEPIGDLFAAIVNEICKVFGIHSPAKKMEKYGKYILLGVVEGFKGAFSDMSKAIGKFYEEIIKPMFTTKKIKENIGSIKKALKEKWDEAKNWWNSKVPLKEINTTVFGIKDKLKEAWSKAIDWWNKDKPSLSEIVAKIKIPHLEVEWDVKGSAAKVLQKLGLKGFPNFSVKYYASGGFPEDGWFRANHGEIMGKFDNGKSVVVNNKQITDGISQAVYQGNREMIFVMRQGLQETQRQNDILIQILQKEFGITKDDIGRAAQDYARDYRSKTGREAFIF